MADHINTNGAKGIDHLIDDFRSTCSDAAYLQKLQELYQQSREALSDHLIEEYKKVGNYGLDIHIFFRKAHSRAPNLRTSGRSSFIFTAEAGLKANQPGISMPAGDMLSRAG